MDNPVINKQLDALIAICEESFPVGWRTNTKRVYHKYRMLYFRLAHELVTNKVKLIRASLGTEWKAVKGVNRDSLYSEKLTNTLKKEYIHIRKKFLENKQNVSTSELINMYKIEIDALKEDNATLREELFYSFVPIKEFIKSIDFKVVRTLKDLSSNEDIYNALKKHLTKIAFEREFKYFPINEKDCINFSKKYTKSEEQEVFLEGAFTVLNHYKNIIP